MPYVDDYVTEEEFNKYEFSKYPRYYNQKYHPNCAGGNIDRESILTIIQLPNRDGEGNVRYAFMIKDVCIEFDYNSKSEYIDDNGNIFNSWNFREKKYPKKIITHRILRNVSNKELCIKYQDLINEAFIAFALDQSQEYKNIDKENYLIIGE